MTSPERTKLDRIINAYDRFVPRKLMHLTGKTDITRVALGDHCEKRVNVLFSDIWNFTPLSESLTPKENFNFLNSYLRQLEPVLSRYDGIIDKYVGDAVMALFTGSADDAVLGALGMLEWLDEYNRGRKRAGYVPIEIGIGLNTGILMLGTVGGSKRMDYTVIGDAVNLASRIEYLTRTFGVNLLISEHTYRSLADPDRYSVRFIDRLVPKGISHPVSFYELFDRDPPALKKAKTATRSLFEEAIANYHYRNIGSAERLFSRCLEKSPDDHAAAVYLERCRQFRLHGIHHQAGELQSDIRWQSSYRIGIPAIDSQHCKLFGFAGKLISRAGSETIHRDIREGFQFLREYAATHFADEVQFLESISYPFLENQKQQHTRFIRDLLLLEKEFSGQAGKGSLYAQFRIHILIVGWIIHHILGEDLHYAKWSRERNNTIVNE